MSVPTLTVKIAFASDPLDTTPTWTDVSSYVRTTDGVGVATRRGRNSELEEFSAGTATLVLSNRDRRFDPLYSSGPYYGNLVPGKQIQIYATWSGVDYDIFTGWVTGWPQDYPNLGKDATVTIQCVDALAWLAKARLPTDLVYTYAATRSPLELMLRRTSDYLWLDETGNSDGASLVYGARKSSSSMTPGSSMPAIEFDGSTVWGLTAPYDSSGGGWSIAFTVKTTMTGTGHILGDRQGAINTAGTAIGVDDGAVFWIGGLGGFLTDSVSTTVKINDGNPHHVVITGDGAGTEDDVVVYIDNVAVPLTRGGVGAGFGDLWVSFVGDSSGSPNNPAALTVFTGSVQDVAIFGRVLLADEVDDLYSYTFGWGYDDAATRVDRALDDAGWPSAWRDLTTVPKSLCAQLVYNGAQAIDLIHQAERTEQGRVFASKSNDVTLLQRYHTSEETRGSTVQVTFSDDGNDVGYRVFGFRYDDIDIQNDVTVSAAQIGSGRATDVTSVSTYGPKAVSVDTALGSVDLAVSMATGLVAMRKDPLYRLNAITTNNIPSAKWPNVLGLELGDRIQAEITPMKTGSQVSQQMTTEGLAWFITQREWVLTIQGAPVPPDFFIVGSSLVGGSDLVGF